MIAAAVVSRFGQTPESLRRVRSYYCSFGVGIGLSAGFVLGAAVKNFTGSVWAFFSALMAAASLREARKDDGPVPRTTAIFIAAMSLLASVGSLAGYLAFAARQGEPLSATGHYVDAVWAFVSAKWALTWAYYAWQRHLHVDYTPRRAYVVFGLVGALAAGLALATGLLLSRGDVDDGELPWLLAILASVALLFGEVRVSEQHYLTRATAAGGGAAGLARNRATVYFAALAVLAGTAGAVTSGVRMAETEHTLFDGSDSQAGAAVAALCALVGYVLGWNATGNWLLLANRQHRRSTLQEDLFVPYAQMESF